MSSIEIVVYVGNDRHSIEMDLEDFTATDASGAEVVGLNMDALFRMMDEAYMAVSRSVGKVRSCAPRPRTSGCGDPDASDHCCDTEA